MIQGDTWKIRSPAPRERSVASAPHQGPPQSSGPMDLN